MASKSKTIKMKLSEKQAELDNIQKMAVEAEQEEQEKISSVKEQITAICTSNEMFCGIILTPNDITAIVDLALKSRENVKIPYTLYFND